MLAGTPSRQQGSHASTDAGQVPKGLPAGRRSLSPYIAFLTFLCADGLSRRRSDVQCARVTGAPRTQLSDVCRVVGMQV